MAFTLEQISALVDAGFAFDDIMKMHNGVGKSVDNVGNPAPAPAPDSNGAILEAIQHLENMIKANNIRMGGFPAPDGPARAEQVLASIINPPGYTGK